MNSIEMVFPPKKPKSLELLSVFVKTSALSNQQRQAQSAELEKEHKSWCYTC